MWVADSYPFNNFIITLSIIIINKLILFSVGIVEIYQIYQQIVSLENDVSTVILYHNYANASEYIECPVEGRKYNLN